MASTFQNFMNQLPTKSGLGFNYQTGPVVNTDQTATTNNGQSTYAQNLINGIKTRTQNAQQTYNTAGTDANTKLASDIVSKSAGTIPTDEFGIPTQTLTNYSDVFNQQLQSTNQIGQSALETTQAKIAWQQANAANTAQAQWQANQNALAGDLTSSIPAGASSNNPGARAVALAMTAYKNHTPYVWGGNSLKNGIDCSGLVQQVYKQLGISLPRTSYAQAKSGHVVSLDSLQPGDLVFYYNANDPNGIKNDAHVAIYIGGGQVIEAASSKIGMRIRSVGNAEGAVRPY